MREEIDAMRTLGIAPMDTLVLPRILALVVALPLLTFIGDLMGLAGGGVMAFALLGLDEDARGDRRHAHARHRPDGHAGAAAHPRSRRGAAASDLHRRPDGACRRRRDGLRFARSRRRCARRSTPCARSASPRWTRWCCRASSLSSWRCRF